MGNTLTFSSLFIHNCLFGAINFKKHYKTFEKMQKWFSLFLHWTKYFLCLETLWTSFFFFFLNFWLKSSLKKIHDKLWNKIFFIELLYHIIIDYYVMLLNYYNVILNYHNIVWLMIIFYDWILIISLQLL